MALVAMTTSDTVEYVSGRNPAKTRQTVFADPSDPSKGTVVKTVIGEGATVFVLKPLDVFLMSWIYDNASALSGKQGSDEVGIQTRVNQTNLDAVRFSLTGFRNFMDAKGNHVLFKTKKAVVAGREYTVADDDTLSSLGLKLISELADHVKLISDVSTAEEKNSAGASQQSA